MVQDVSQSRLMMLFIEGLMEPLRGWVKDFKPTNLHNAIWKTKDLGSTTKMRFTPGPPLNQGGRDQRPPMNQGGRDQQGIYRGRGMMDECTRRELRRKQLCFTCKEPWDPTHKCMGKGNDHYIEVFLEDEEEEYFGHLQNIEAEATGHAEEEDASHDLATDEKVTLASINRVPKFNTFRMRGVLQGHKVSVLIDGGASHNFIDSSLLQRRHISTDEFEGFRVEVVGGAPCLVIDTFQE
jgi:hypothetical protein